MVLVTPDRLADRYGDDRVFAHDWPWEVFERVQKWAARALCLIAGHQAERDQCGRPEHDHCLWCKRAMPGQWKAPT